MEKSYYSAILIYKDLIEKFPQYSKRDETLYRLGKLYLLHDNLSESIRTFEKIINDYNKSDYFYGSHYYLGVIYLTKSDEKEALQYFDYIIQQNKKDKFFVMALIGKGNIYYDNKDYNKGIDFYKQALDVKLKNLYPVIYLGLANSYMKLKDYENAYYYYKMILKDFPGSSEYELALDKLKYMNETKSILDKIDFEKMKMERPRAITKTGLAKEYYTIQISSEKDKRYANDWRVKLKVQGFDSFFREYKTKTNVFYRTYVGRFDSQEQAEAEKKKVELKFKLDCIITKIQ